MSACLKERPKSGHPKSSALVTSGRGEHTPAGHMPPTAPCCELRGLVPADMQRSTIRSYAEFRRAESYWRYQTMSGLIAETAASDETLAQIAAAKPSRICIERPPSKEALLTQCCGKYRNGTSALWRRRYHRQQFQDRDIKDTPHTPQTNTNTRPTGRTRESGHPSRPPAASHWLGRCCVSGHAL